jgi:hypothetical protein
MCHIVNENPVVAGIIEGANDGRGRGRQGRHQNRCIRFPRISSFVVIAGVVTQQVLDTYRSLILVKCLSCADM